MASLDYLHSSRDPRHLNDHVKVLFDEVIGEPEGAYSDECIWERTGTFYNAGRRCCYLVLTYLCALPFAFCWGCEMACVSFCHIWSVTPRLRVLRIHVGSVQKLWGIMVSCCCAPICEVFALILSKIVVTSVTGVMAYQAPQSSLPPSAKEEDGRMTV